MDDIYMTAVQTLTGHRGLAALALPDSRGKAVLRRHLLPAGGSLWAGPGFGTVLASIAQAWKSRPDEIETSAGGALRAPRDRRAAACRAGQRVGARDPRAGRARARGRVRPGARRLRRRARSSLRRCGSSCCSAGAGGPASPPRATMVQTTLEKMAAGGLYDQIGGGFHRYSVDERWVGAALREDALRQRDARARVPARRPRLRPGGLSRDRPRDARLPAARDDAAGRRVLRRAGRRLGRPRGDLLRLESRSRCARPSAPKRRRSSARASA